MDVEYAENQAPPAAKGKAAKAAKAASQQPLAQNNSQAAANGKSIEEMYQKKTQLEHILLRPDTYIGSTERQAQQIWVHDGQRMELRNINIVPGLYKIFDEILVNAADNKVRDASMDTVKVVIDPVANSIQVWNNGRGIPVEVHKEEGIYVPELIFGQLLTSSNYDDSEKKITGGRNGYGAKLANIFSTEFIVETADGTRQRKYKQVFSSNMSKKGDPKITDCKASDNWTCITFKPDLAKFGMDCLDEDTVALMRRRVYDLAGILGKGTKVYLNGERLPVKSFSEYIDLYLGPKEGGVPRWYERFNDRWEICVSPTDGQFNQVSFVNSIATTKGGTHVEYIVNQITKYVCEKLNKKVKNANVKPFMVKNHLWVFVNANVENPAFDSQTKENLTLRATSFGSKCELPVPYLEKLCKGGLADNIVRFAEFKNQKELKKSDGAKRSRLIGITKLDDANDAGTARSKECTLILTEGDSAKALAISGLGVVGRDHYGVFPLRGKLLNVRDASAAQVSQNQEIQHIKQILGLQHGKVYEDASSLRYGHLMIMTDQDHDGSHIKGLIMNFLHTFYPSLLKLPGFLLEFITPIIKARKGRQVLSFYTIPEYESWKESIGGSTSGWEIKYYKGLGTSTKDEAQEYFSALNKHRKEFAWQGDEDHNAIEMAFSKKRVEDRKDWLRNFVPGTYLDQSAQKISYTDFINKELILFSRADLDRSIPSMVDGLKPGQRKILFACFKRNLKKDIKVAQLSAYVAEHSAYHHGEQSLASTIVNLAQDFVGSNNINLLHPSGQFGTRLQGGKDAASARYIYTRLAPLTRNLFSEHDDVLLNYLNEEGQSIEPDWYIPIVPTVLMNGAEGIGTGWSTTIPNYNPRDIVANLKRLLNGEEQLPLHPWYRGFKGTIQEVPSKGAARSYICNGMITVTGDNTVEITELPIRKWTQDYKEFLETLVKPEEKDDAPILADYREHHSDANVHFVLQFLPGKLEELMAAPGGLEAKLKLQTKMATSNMMLFNKDGVIQQYQSPESIIQEFFDLRLEYYEKRRLAMLQTAQQEQRRADNKVRFIRAVVAGTLKVSNRKRADIEADLEAQGFDRMPSKNSKGRTAATEEPAEDEEEGAEAAIATGTYDYLLSMSIYSLTLERIQALQAEADAHAARVGQLQATTGRQMWHDDLDAFKQVYEEWETLELARADEATRKQLAARRKGGKGQGKAPVKGKGKKKDAWDSDGNEDDDMDDPSDDEFEPEARKKPAPARKPPASKPAPVPAAPPPAPAPQPVAVAPAAPAANAKARATKPAARKAPAKKKAMDSDEDMGEAASSGSDFEDDEDFGDRPAVKATKKAAAAQPKAAPAAKAAGPPTKAVGKPPGVVAPSGSEISDDQTADTAPQDSYVGNLAARLAGRMKHMTVGSNGGAATTITLDDGEVNSPAPVKKTAAAPKGAAAAKPAAAKPAAPKPVPAKKANAKEDSKQPAKRKGKVISDSDDGSASASSSEDEDAYELTAPSPAVAPKGKKGRVGPSPLHIKAMSRLGATAAARGGTAAMGTVPEEAAAAAATAAARPRRAAAAKTVDYVTLDDSDEDEGGKEDDSDFEVLSDDE